MKTTPLNIKDPTAYALATELARLKGKSMTRVVVEALQNELNRFAVKAIDENALQSLLARVDALPRIQDGRTDEEILGYNEEGHWG